MVPRERGSGRGRASCWEEKTLSGDGSVLYSEGVAAQIKMEQIMIILKAAGTSLRNSERLKAPVIYITVAIQCLIFTYVFMRKKQCSRKVEKKKSQKMQQKKKKLNQSQK